MLTQKIGQYCHISTDFTCLLTRPIRYRVNIRLTTIRSFLLNFVCVVDSVIKRFFTGAIAAVVLTASTATAATLSLYGTGQTHNVTGNDILPGVNNTSIDFIDGASKTSNNGLFLNASGDTSVTYTFLGGEAGHRNFSAVVGDFEFFNRGIFATSAGAQATVTQQSSGFLDFAFGTYAPLWAVGLFNNDGTAVPNSSNFAMGFVQISATAFYVLFDDIASGDRDFDDMAMRIDVAPVPLPAGGLLLLSALGAALLLRRQSKMA